MLDGNDSVDQEEPKLSQTPLKAGVDKHFILNLFKSTFIYQPSSKSTRQKTTSRSKIGLAEFPNVMSDSKKSTNCQEPETSQTSLKAKFDKKSSRRAKTSSSKTGLTGLPGSMLDGSKSTNLGEPEVSKTTQKAEADKNSFLAPRSTGLLHNK